MWAFRFFIRKFRASRWNMFDLVRKVTCIIIYYCIHKTNTCLLNKTLDATENLHERIIQKLYSYICIKTSSMYFQRTKNPKLWPVRWNKHSAIEQDWPCNCKLELTVSHIEMIYSHRAMNQTTANRNPPPSLSETHHCAHLPLIGHWHWNRPHPPAID